MIFRVKKKMLRKFIMDGECLLKEGGGESGRRL